MAAGNKKPTKRPGGAAEGGAHTTVTTRLTARQIEQVRDAAKRCGWSLAQFLQRSAVERATEIVNRDDNRDRISKAARSVVGLFGYRPLRIVFGGETWVSDEPGWYHTVYSAPGRHVSALPRGEYVAIMEDTDPGGTNRSLTTQGISVFHKADFEELWLDEDAWRFGDAFVSEPNELEPDEFESPPIPRTKALVRVEQALPPANVRDVMEAIAHSGREFAVLMTYERGNRNRPREYVDAASLLGNGKVSGSSAKGERS